MADEYEAWLEEHLGAWIRHGIQLEPAVAARYQAAFQGDPVGQQWLAVADAIPSTGATDTGVVADSIAPDGVPAETRAELDALAAHLTNEEKAVLAGLTADEITAALDQAREELAAEMPFAGVDDDGFTEAVTGEPSDAAAGPTSGEPGGAPDGAGSIAPVGVNAETRAELDALAAHLTDEEKAVLADLTADEITAALDQAREELAAEMPFAGVDDDGFTEAVTGGAPTVGDDGSPAATVSTDEVLTPLDDADLAAVEQLVPETPETIVPEDADALLKVDIDGLVPLMSDEEKATLAALDPAELEALLAEARADEAAAAS